MNNIRQRFRELKTLKSPIQENSEVSLSCSGKAFLIRLARHKLGLAKFKAALRELKTINRLLLREYPGTKLRFSSEKLFWTLPANELTAEFLDYWTTKFRIPAKLE